MSYIIFYADSEMLFCIFSFFNSSKTALTMAGVNSFDARPYRPPITFGFSPFPILRQCIDNIHI